jgi:signal transduction histidine kinase
MKFLQTFRARLLVVLALLLVLSLGVQYYLNYTVQIESAENRELREQALVAGIGLGFSALTQTDPLEKFVLERGVRFLDEDLRSRIDDIILIDPSWQVYDSLSQQRAPEKTSSNETILRKLSDLTELPPPKEGLRLGEDFQKFPNHNAPQVDVFEGESHAVPLETDKGRYYVMVILKDEREAAAMRAIKPLAYTLSVLLASSLVTLLLVWRFSSPISNLSAAAQKVAKGDFSVRVAVLGSDEIGQLAKRFNEMVAEIERKRGLEAKLAEAEKSAMVGRLGASIAHEIRNPLNYINLSLDHLAVKLTGGDAETTEKFREIVSNIKSEIRRIEARVSELLDFARIPQPEFSNLRVAEVVRESLKIIEAEASERGVTVGMIEDGVVAEVNGDGEYLRSLFSNLFINAVKAMEGSGGTLKVTIREEGDFIVIDVTDSGVGISGADLEMIFEPYFSTRATGTGLGLAIARRMAEIHGGSITASSEVGVGTTFTVKLPKQV